MIRIRVVFTRAGVVASVAVFSPARSSLPVVKRPERRIQPRRNQSLAAVQANALGISLTDVGAYSFHTGLAIEFKNGKPRAPSPVTRALTLSPRQAGGSSAPSGRSPAISAASSRARSRRCISPRGRRPPRWWSGWTADRSECRVPMFTRSGSLRQARSAR